MNFVFTKQVPVLIKFNISCDHRHMYVCCINKLWKFGSFAYSIWPPKWPNYLPINTFFSLHWTLFFIVSTFYLYMYWWHICIFNIADNMAKLSSEPHIFYPAVSNLYCKHLLLVYIEVTFFTTFRMGFTSTQSH